MLCSTLKGIVSQKQPSGGVQYCRLIEYGIINYSLDDLGTTAKKCKMNGPKGKKTSEILLIKTKNIK